MDDVNGISTSPRLKPQEERKKRVSLETRKDNALIATFDLSFDRGRWQLYNVQKKVEAKPQI